MYYWNYFSALKIHISKETADCLSKFKEYKLIPRGRVEIKVIILQTEDVIS